MDEWLKKLLESQNKDYSGMFGGAEKFLDDNESILGLAGSGLDWYNQKATRDLQEEYAAKNLKMEQDKLAMTQRSYNNELYRSNMLEQQNAGSKGFYGRQYVGPQDTHPGAQQAAPAQGLAGQPVKQPTTSAYTQPRLA